MNIRGLSIVLGALLATPLVEPNATASPDANEPSRIGTSTPLPEQLDVNRTVSQAASNAMVRGHHASHVSHRSHSSHSSHRSHFSSSPRPW